MKIVFEIQGAPVGWRQMAVALAYKTASHGYRFPKGSAVAIIIHAYYPIPDGTSEAKRAEMITGNLQPTVKPDIDNFCKIILDALSGGIAYEDGNQVVGAIVWKWYSDTPHIVVAVQDASRILRIARGEDI